MEEVKFVLVSPGLFNVVDLKGAIWRETILSNVRTLLSVSGDIQARLYWTEIHSNDLDTVRFLPQV